MDLIAEPAATEVDVPVIAVSIAAMVLFVAVGLAVAIFGGPSDSEVAEVATQTTAAPVPTTSTTMTTTVPPRPEPFGVVFDTTSGLGFEQRRAWTYDPATRVLESLQIFDTEIADLDLVYTEVLPKSVLDLGDVMFDPESVVTLRGANGASGYKFNLKIGIDQPAEIRWSITVSDPLTPQDLERLAADRDAAETLSLAAASSTTGG